MAQLYDPRGDRSMKQISEEHWNELVIEWSLRCSDFAKQQDAKVHRARGWTYGNVSKRRIYDKAW